MPLFAPDESPRQAKFASAGGALPAAVRKNRNALGDRLRGIFSAPAPPPGNGVRRRNRRFRGGFAARDSGNLAPGLGFAIGHLDMLRAV